jgi:transposase
MNFTEPLEAAEKITLREMHAEHPSPSVRMRAHAVLLSDKEFETNEISEILDKCRQAVSGRITTWRRSGLTGLFNASGGGRQKTLTEEEKTALEIIKKEPRRIKAAISEIEKLSGKKISN